MAKYIISLKALGYDARKIVTVNSEAGTYLDLTARLKDIIASADLDIYTLPYVLLALQQDDSYADTSVTDKLIQQLLSAQLEDGRMGSVCSRWGYYGSDYFGAVQVLRQR